ncbi:MAG: uracil-DNA glycosylase family protein [Alphaproteobacteria bacterium]|nr:uracil-DNA glycosylase family protein [Alphaproteobacteria bacterium]
MSGRETFDQAVEAASACTLCAGQLPRGPRPVFRASPTARLMIVGQAPGARVHETGIPWNDASGRRLRDWLALDSETFYDASRIAILPVGFCYPGRYERGGDLPPRSECAPLWHRRLTAHMSDLGLVLLIGQYAQAHYLDRRCHRSLTETVAAWRDYLPDYLPMPHPSWRNTAWLRRNPWFEMDLLPDLRARICRILS